MTDVALGSNFAPTHQSRPGRPSVTVVVCAHTARRWSDTLTAVRGALRQGAYQVVLVVDHAEDLRDRLAEALPGVLVAPNRHQRGLAGARNTGVELASGDVVVFLDDDAEPAEGWLDHLLAPYADLGVVGVGGRAEPRWPHQRPAWFPSEFDWVIGCSYSGLPETADVVRNLIGANMSFRRSVFDAVGAFSLALGRVGQHPAGCEETEFCIRLRRYHPDVRLVYEPAAVVWHRVTEDRRRWAYFRARCFAEGQSKAVVSKLVGAGDGLATERVYARAVLTRGVGRNLRAVARGDVCGLMRAAAITAGFGATVLGYLAGRVRLLGAASPEDTSARPAAPNPGRETPARANLWAL